jgi:hypothetical protein
MVTPYMAVILAHEDMSIYAYVSIVEAILKLGIVFILKFILMDKLQLYGILVFVVTAVNTSVYRTICRVKYNECIARFCREKKLFGEIVSYIAWTLFGSISKVFFLVYLFALPFMLEISTIYTLWLKGIPEYVVLFSRPFRQR